MEKVWSLAAIVCAVAAFIFFWFGNFDGVFVTAVLGSIFWLLNYRQQARSRVPQPAVESNDES